MATIGEAGTADSVLAVVAHPDDADFWAAGTIAHWTAAGSRVAYCVLTDGDSGGFDPAVPRAEIPTIRRAEQRAAADLLGVKEVEFLGYRDGYLTPTIELRRDIARVIRQWRPERVLTWSPEWNWQRPSHPDHRATGEAAWSAIYPDAGNPFAHPELLTGEGLRPWRVREVWMIGSPQPNRYVDITGGFERKVAALRAHVSQTAHRDRLADEMRERLAPNAEAAGLPPDRVAEAFQVVTIA
jgi:LmbE family N-acetylglucosaminyl deacetylase